MWHDFFYFPKSDRRAIIILSVIAVAFITALAIRHCSNGKTAEKAISSVDSVEVNKGDGTISSEKEPSPLQGSGVKREVHCTGIFDPNTVDSVTLVSFGLRPWQAKNLIRYREAGGVFHEPEDIRKLYGWTEQDASALLPHIVIGEKYHKKHSYSQPDEQKSDERSEEWEKDERNKKNTHFNGGEKYPKKYKTLTLTDPNTADSMLLRRIPGIGEKISNAIITYRTKLGGFYAEQQLLEIPIVSPELLKWFEIHDADIRKIRINTASFQTLNSHPYITYEQTRSLLQYIRLYGKIENTDALRNTNIFSEEELEKILPYLEF